MTRFSQKVASKTSKVASKKNLLATVFFLTGVLLNIDFTIRLQGCK